MALDLYVFSLRTTGAVFPTVFLPNFTAWVDHVFSLFFGKLASLLLIVVIGNKT
jgi:hypothetical protein